MGKKDINPDDAEMGILYPIPENITIIIQGSPAKDSNIENIAYMVRSDSKEGRIKIGMASIPQVTIKYFQYTVVNPKIFLISLLINCSMFWRRR